MQTLRCKMMTWFSINLWCCYILCAWLRYSKCNSNGHALRICFYQGKSLTRESNSKILRFFILSASWLLYICIYIYIYIYILPWYQPFSSFFEGIPSCPCRGVVQLSPSPRSCGRSLGRSDAERSLVDFWGTSHAKIHKNIHQNPIFFGISWNVPDLWLLMFSLFRISGIFLMDFLIWIGCS